MLKNYLRCYVKKIDNLRAETVAIHGKISELETALTATSDLALKIDKEHLPKLKAEFKTDMGAIDNKMLLTELHHRKYNLLFYGVQHESNEDVYSTLQRVIVDIGIPREDAANMLFANAHRLPRKIHGAAAEPRNAAPDPIIAKFILMCDRDRVLSAYESKPKHARSTTNPSSVPASDRISVRTDLPPPMKARRSQLASIAYKLRREKNLSTKIFVRNTEVILQHKEKGTREWITYKE